MTIQVYHEPCEVRAVKELPRTYHIIATDVPFNTSEVSRSSLVFNEKWDTGWSPLSYFGIAKKLLVPGGWNIAKTGDRTFGIIRDIFSQDHSTTRGYLDWLFKINVLGTDGYEEAMCNLPRVCANMPDFEMKATLTWFKKSGVHSTRKTTYRSLCEWFLVFKRLDEFGKSVTPPAWNFKSQSGMVNHIECVPCGPSEKLYWHLRDPEEVDGELRGSIVPCHDKNGCDICAQAKKLGHEPGKNLNQTPIELQRRSHPTQTPLYIWRWLFERHCRQGMKLFDPYCGLFGSGIVAKEFGMDAVGTDSCWEYARVAQMRIAGEWPIPQPESGVEQLSYLDDTDA